MTTKTIFMILPILVTVTLLAIPSATYAHDGHNHSSGGGGCSDCSPPTLGVDSQGQTKVSGGFSMNDQTTDAGMFKQDLEPQILKTGEPVDVTLKIYENRGYEGLKHVEINLGHEDKFVSGVMVAHHPVTIEWSKNFNGETTVIVSDKQNLVTDVNVQVLDNNPIIGVKFTFTPVKEFDASTIVTRIWDEGRNSNVNYFHNAMEIISDKSTTSSDLLQEISDENYVENQTTIPLSNLNQNTTCSDDKVHLIRTTNGYSMCVTEPEAVYLTQNNLAIPTP